MIDIKKSIFQKDYQEAKYFTIKDLSSKIKWENKSDFSENFNLERRIDKDVSFNEKLNSVFSTFKLSNPNIIENFNFLSSLIQRTNRLLSINLLDSFCVRLINSLISFYKEINIETTRKSQVNIAFFFEKANKLSASFLKVFSKLQQNYNEKQKSFLKVLPNFLKEVFKQVELPKSDSKNSEELKNLILSFLIITQVLLSKFPSNVRSFESKIKEFLNDVISFKINDELIIKLMVINYSNLINLAINKQQKFDELLKIILEKIENLNKHATPIDVSAKMASKKEEENSKLNNLDDYSFSLKVYFSMIQEIILFTKTTTNIKEPFEVNFNSLYDKLSPKPNFCFLKENNPQTKLIISGLSEEEYFKFLVIELELKCDFLIFLIKNFNKSVAYVIHGKVNELFNVINSSKIRFIDYHSNEITRRFLFSTLKFCTEIIFACNSNFFPCTVLFKESFENFVSKFIFTDISGLFLNWSKEEEILDFYFSFLISFINSNILLYSDKYLKLNLLNLVSFLIPNLKIKEEKSFFFQGVFSQKIKIRLNEIVEVIITNHFKFIGQDLKVNLNTINYENLSSQAFSNNSFIPKKVIDFYLFTSSPPKRKSLETELKLCDALNVLYNLKKNYTEISENLVNWEKEASSINEDLDQENGYNIEKIKEVEVNYELGIILNENTNKINNLENFARESLISSSQLKKEEEEEYKKTSSLLIKDDNDYKYENLIAYNNENLEKDTEVVNPFFTNKSKNEVKNENKIKNKKETKKNSKKENGKAPVKETEIKESISKGVESNQFFNLTRNIQENMIIRKDKNTLEESNKSDLNNLQLKENEELNTIIIRELRKRKMSEIEVEVPDLIF